MIPTVEKRRVSRWFYKGKGFATETAALRFIAEAELRAEMYETARALFNNAFANKPEFDAWDDDPDYLKPYILQAYAEKFQHTPGHCDRYLHGRFCAQVGGGVYRYSVCRVAKAEYLEKRVAELRAAGVVKVKQ